jgi:hypothetical protein
LFSPSSLLLSPCSSCSVIYTQAAAVQVYDLQNKVVAASAPVQAPLRWMAAHTTPGTIDIGGPLLAVVVRLPCLPAAGTPVLSLQTLLLSFPVRLWLP